MKNSLKTYNNSFSGTGSVNVVEEKIQTQNCNFTVDHSFVIKSWNSEMEKLSHKLAESVVGSKIDKVFPFLHDEIALAFSIGKRRRIKNFNNVCFMGTDLCGDIQIIPIKDKKGKVKEVSVMLDKIKGKCPLDKKLSESEKMVAIGKIASSLAHGVRNPLNAIKGAVVYLKEKYGHESTLREFSTIIDEEIDKLDNFISNFLSASRGDLIFVPINLNGLLKSIISMVKPRADIQEVNIIYKFAVLTLVTADSFQLEQALFNIINNALEAMPDGGEMNIKTSKVWEASNDYALIEISDTGKGIPDAELDRLGELSSDVEKSGRGFGIFLSREVIKSHNGKLLWESKRGIGTTFKIFLPISQSAE